MGGLFFCKNFWKKIWKCGTDYRIFVFRKNSSTFLPNFLTCLIMNIQKYLGHDGQPTHYAFSANVMAHETKQWAQRLEAAISASRVRLVADIEVIAGRVVAGHTMVKIYLLFDQQMHTRDIALIHLTSFCNVLGAHGFSAAARSIELNFINTDSHFINA